MNIDGMYSDQWNYMNKYKQGSKKVAAHSPCPLQTLISLHTKQYNRQYVSIVVIYIRYGVNLFEVKT